MPDFTSLAARIDRGLLRAAATHVGASANKWSVIDDARAALAEMKERAEKLEAALAEADDIIGDAWTQWAYEIKPGKYVNGGLSTLEWIEDYLNRRRAALSSPDEIEQFDALEAKARASLSSPETPRP